MSLNYGNDCVDANGRDMTIEGNRVGFCDGDGIETDGGAQLVTGNWVSFTEDGGFDFGCGASTCAARSVFTGGPGIEACQQFDEMAACEMAWHLEGEGALSCYWTGSHCQDCFQGNEDCTNACTDAVDCTLSFNRVDTATEDECYEIQGNDILVEYNIANGCEDDAFQIRGSSNHLRYNKSNEGTAYERADGFEIQGVGHTLEYNTSTDAARDGFNIIDSGHSLSHNVARNSGEDGFDVGGQDELANDTVDIILESNTATDNNGMGIEVSAHAVDSIIDDNDAEGNRVDLCDEGSGTSGSDVAVVESVCFVELLDNKSGKVGMLGSEYNSGPLL
jgi:parallel beta-helix repeat protein